MKCFAGLRILIERFEPMKSEGGKTDSIWATTATVSVESPLNHSANTGVCIIGAGIAGLTTAYLLAKEGKSVIVLDDGPIGGGETGRTTAHLSNALDDRYFEIERLHGAKGARLAAESHTAAIDRIEQIVREEKIDCDFERLDGFLFRFPGQAAEYLDEEFEAARRAGADVQMAERAPIPQYNSGKCLRFPGQAMFHPLRYLSGLAGAIERMGGMIYTRSHVEEIRDGHPVQIRVKGGYTVSATAAVVATNTPINDWVKIHTKQAPYRTYVIGALVAKNAIPRALFWDTADPYHYVRLQNYSERHDVLIIGGEDHKTGQAHHTVERFERLEDWAREMFPEIEYVEFTWSGQVMEPVDALAFIGRNPGEECVYIATGDSGHGMTHGTIAGVLLTDLIQSRENAWAQLYDPSRKTIRAIGEFAKQNLNVFAQYAEFFKPGDVTSEDRIPNGHGAVMRRGLQKIAVYRDEAGELHSFSAVCPHLGCVVDWNSTEQTWDCPCHGSRFDPQGKVINGPANSDLGPADDDEPEPTEPVVASV